MYSMITSNPLIEVNERLRRMDDALPSDAPSGATCSDLRIYAWGKLMADKHPNLVVATPGMHRPPRGVRDLPMRSGSIRGSSFRWLSAILAIFRPSPGPTRKVR